MAQVAAAQPIVASVAPARVYEDHESTVLAVAVFPDGRRMVTSSGDKTLRLWDLKVGIVLKKMEGHRQWVRAVAVSKDGQLIASGDLNGELIVWHGETGEQRITQSIRAHPAARINSLDFSADGALLASGSSDNTTKLWIAETWLPQGNRINCGAAVYCVRYSSSSEFLAIATGKDIQIWNPTSRERITNFNAATVSPARNYSLAWTPDGTRLFSGGCNNDPTIREWDLSTMQQVGDPWDGHTAHTDIYAIAVNPAGTLVASASEDKHVRLWRLWDRRTIAIFKHSGPVSCVTFSIDGKHILSGSQDKKISKWAIPEDASPDCKIIDIHPIVRNACISGDLPIAEELLTQAIDADENDHISFANRSFVMARKLDWDGALQDALQSLRIKPSLTGHISKGIALCGKNQTWEAMQALDIAFMFTNEDSKIIHFLLLIKAVVLFNANRHDEAMVRLQELATTCPGADTLACHIVEAYLRFQLGVNALNGLRYSEAADHFNAAVDISAFSSKWAIHSVYEDFVILFGWNLKSFWQTSNKHRCNAHLSAGRLGEAVKSHQYMMYMSDETTKASCLGWSTNFKKECSVLYAARGDAALAACDYDSAIREYSAAIDLHPASDAIYASRSMARSGKMLWEEALLDAQKVIQLNSSSHLGYQLKHTALHGAKRYDEAIKTFQIMLSKLDSASETQIRALRLHYVNESEAEDVIRRVIDAHLDLAPLHLINTLTGRLCDREAQINAFKMSSEYKKLLSSTTKRADIDAERIKETVELYFRRVMLSHKWEGNEPLLHDIQGKVVYQLNPVGGILKLQLFCNVARNAGYLWAWSDTCCIDKNNHVELQRSVTSMFVWYRHSALTIVYLSNVPPSSEPGALAKSEWIRRGWTVQEFLAPKVVLFYQKDWTPYLGDNSPNHKESVGMMQELADATGIDPRALIAFRPGMGGAREKLQWASTRVTTLQEDIAYSLFGLFNVHLPIIYGEKKQNALGRLLQEIIAQSGDIGALDWVGKSSEFNSCLPAEITSYKAAPRRLPSVSEDEMQTLVSSLRGTGIVEWASKLYATLDNLSAPRFSNCRLHLHCIAFRITEVGLIRRYGQDQETCATYEVKADGLRDLQVTTDERLVQFSPARPTWQTFLLVRPWNRHLLEFPGSTDDAQSVGDWPTPRHSYISFNGSHGENGSRDPDSQSRALRLIVRLGQPFSAFLLARQRGGEFKRIASDREIVAQVRDTTSVRDMMDVRTLEIL